MKGWLRHVGVGAVAVAIIIAWSTAIAGMAACGGTGRSDTLRASVIAVNSARDTYMRWSAARQIQIVTENATREGRDKATAEHRKRRDAVLFIFGGVYERLARATAGKDKRELDEAVKAAAKVTEAMKDLDPATEGPKPEDLPPPINVTCEPCAACSTAPCPSLDAAKESLGLTDGGTDAP